MGIKKLKIKGTKEWVAKSFNIQEGCPYNCQYPCYARCIRRKNEEEWKNPIFKEKWFNQKIENYRKGFLANVMCFSLHDIYPKNQNKCLDFILRIMNESNNSVLITTKANLDTLIYLCKNLKDFKERISFMITITTKYDSVSCKYEPNAPMITERFNALDYLNYYDWIFNVSIEPYLDKNPLFLIDFLIRKYPHIKTIWLGCNSRKDYEIYSLENLNFIQKEIETYYKENKDSYKIYLKNSFIDKIEKMKIA